MRTKRSCAWPFGNDGWVLSAFIFYLFTFTYLHLSIYQLIDESKIDVELSLATISVLGSPESETGVHWYLAGTSASTQTTPLNKYTA